MVFLARVCCKKGTSSRLILLQAIMAGMLIPLLPYPSARSHPEAQRLLTVTEEALYLGIAAARGGNRLRDIGRAVQQHVEAAGFSVVRLYSGHGVGRSMHEDPQVLNYVEPSYPNYQLKPGMVIAIEPMVIMGKPATRVLDDEWTVISVDQTYAAHFEHTVAITEGEAEILTLGNTSNS